VALVEPHTNRVLRYAARETQTLGEHRGRRRHGRPAGVKHAKPPVHARTYHPSTGAALVIPFVAVRASIDSGRDRRINVA